MPWFSYLAFDIIGDLAFSGPFGMAEKGRDEVEAQLSHGGPITINLLPALRPIAKYLPDPFFTKGVDVVANLNGIAVRAVASRFDEAVRNEKGTLDQNDILERLINGNDAFGNKMERKEVTAEALTQFIAGSDTISNTSCAVFYWILHGERARPGTIIPRLQAELDAAIAED